ncbi:MAG: FAD-dependent oxidoreductase [Sporolactobacillus sp.]
MYDLAIIGGGPAGQSAALFASKAGLSTLLLDNEKGLTQRALLKNHYGVFEASGAELVATGRRQIERFGTIIQKAQITGIEPSDGGFLIHSEQGETFTAQQIILATGANAALAQSIGVTTAAGKEKYVKTVIEVDGAGHTNLPGIWAAGVAAGVSVHTIVTSGDGARVAINLISEKQGARYTDHDKLENS